MPARRRRSGRGPPPALDGVGAAGGAGTRMTAPLGYFWGDDGYGLERAATELGKRVAAAEGSDLPLERWRTTGQDADPGHDP